MQMLKRTTNDSAVLNHVFDYQQFTIRHGGRQPLDTQHRLRSEGKNPISGNFAKARLLELIKFIIFTCKNTLTDIVAPHKLIQLLFPRHDFVISIWVHLTPKK